MIPAMHLCKIAMLLITNGRSMATEPVCSHYAIRTIEKGETPLHESEQHAATKAFSVGREILIGTNKRCSIGEYARVGRAEGAVEGTGKGIACIMGSLLCLHGEG